MSIVTVGGGGRGGLRGAKGVIGTVGAGVSPTVVSWNSVGNSGSTATQSVTPSGSRRAIYAWVMHDVDADTFSVDFNTSESFTEIATRTPTSAGNRLFRLLNPTATTADVVATRDTGSGDFAIIVMVASDVYQANPERGVATDGIASSGSVFSRVVSSVHDLVVDGLSQNGTGTLTPDAGQTVQVDFDHSVESRAASTADTPASFFTELGWTVSSNAAHIAASIIGDDGVLSVASLSRDLGPEAGGPTMTITGTGFSGTPQVLFGSGNSASNVVVVSATEITCDIPSGTGTVAVAVDGVSGPDFEYVPAPTAHLDKRANFEDDTFGDFSTTVSAGNSVTITTDVGNGPEGSDKFARCTADTVSGGSDAYLHATDGGNTPLHGGDGYWLSWFVRIEDATTSLLSTGQIKHSLFRGGPVPRWNNEGLGPQFSAGDGEVTAADDNGVTGGLWTDGSVDHPVLMTLGTSKGWTRVDRHFERDDGAGIGTARYFVDGKFVAQDSDTEAGSTGTSAYTQELGIAFHQDTGSGDLVVDIGGVVMADGYVENISGA